MNKAIYGILAAAALATLKKERDIGSSNESNKSLSSNIQSLFSNNRMDVALATVYSFVDFSNVDQYKELSLFSNLNVPLTYIQQNILSLPLSSPEQISGFSNRIAEQIISSFGSEQIAMTAWTKNAVSLQNSYLEYFSNRDYGVAYSLIMSSVYPLNINGEDWFKLFRKSKTDAENIVLTQNIKDMEDKKRIHKQFVSAWLKSHIQPQSKEGLLDDIISFDKIYKNSGDIFYLLATVEPVKNFPIKHYNPGTIYTILDNQHSIVGGVDESGANEFFILDLVLQSLVWIKGRLSAIKDERGRRKYPDSEIDTYEKMWKFWSDPTRVGSETMIFIEMDHYRNSSMTASVPQTYKKIGDGLLEDRWSNSTTKGTPAWATTSWILYYIYNTIEEVKNPSTSEWNEGFSVAVNMFPSIAVNPRKPVLSKPRSIKYLISQIQKYLNTEISDNIIKIIQEGVSDDMVFSTPLKGFTKPSQDSINDYADMISSDKQSDIDIYEAKAGKKLEMLNYVAEYLGHCNTVNTNSEVFVVYYKNVPYYTIEVTSDGKIAQFKGIGNRVMGSMSPANRVSMQQKKSSLYFSDLNNISIVMPVFINKGYSLPNGIFRKGNDLMLYTSNAVSSHNRPEGLASIIKTLTR